MLVSADTGRAMSQENVEVVRRCVETFSRGDLGALFQLVDEAVAPDAELRAFGRLPDGGPVTGREAIKAWFQNMLETVAFHVEAREYIDAGVAVVVVARHTARVLESGAEGASDLVDVFGIRDGMVRYLDAYHTKQEALEAAGLRG